MQRERKFSDFRSLCEAGIKNIEKTKKLFENLLTNLSLCGIISDVDDEYVALAQLDRVFGYEPKGRGFESLMPRKKAEHLVCSAFFVFVGMRSPVQSTKARKKP